jgi:hypothetical protein
LVTASTLFEAAKWCSAVLPVLSGMLTAGAIANFDPLSASRMFMSGVSPSWS